MVTYMICKFCVKNINGCFFVCNKCLEKHKKAKLTYISNGIEYIANIFTTSDNYSRDEPVNTRFDFIQKNERNNSQMMNSTPKKPFVAILKKHTR